VPDLLHRQSHRTGGLRPFEPEKEANLCSVESQALEFTGGGIFHRAGRKKTIEMGRGQQEKIRRETHTKRSDCEFFVELSINKQRRVFITVSYGKLHSSPPLV
jgi:hypothetical protein